MATAWGKLEGFDILSVTRPDLARIVEVLNFKPFVAAESLYVAAGRAGAPAVAAALPTPIATTTAPAMILVLRTFFALLLLAGLRGGTQPFTRGFRARAAPR